MEKYPSVPQAEFMSEQGIKITALRSCHATYKCATVTGLAELWCKPPSY